MSALTAEQRLDRLERALKELADVVLVHFGSTNAGPRPALEGLFDDVKDRVDREATAARVIAEEEHAAMLKRIAAREAKK
jgi:hypothetical protein